MAAQTDPPAGPKWLVPSTLAILVLLSGFLLLRGRSPEKPALPGAGSATPTPIPATSLPATPLAPATPTPEPTPSPEPKVALTEIVLPKAVTLKGAPGGIESQLLAFVQDTSKPAESSPWFIFDRLRFETSRPILKPEAKQQLENMALILKSFPKLHLKIGGYTDNLGSEEANNALSEERAKAVLTALTALGIEKTRLAAQGYGGADPVGDNATEAGRAQNRRIAVQVTQK